MQSLANSAPENSESVGENRPAESAPCRFRVMARDESAYWDSDVLEAAGVRAAFGLYIFREGEATHVCSLTPNTYAEWVENAFILREDAPRDLYDQWTRADLCFENGGDNSGTYFSFQRPEKLDDSPFIGAAFEIDPEEINICPEYGETLTTALFDAAREAFNRGAADRPAILNESTFDGYQAELAAQRRAENRAPLDRDPLPLFDYAARAMLESVPELGATAYRGSDRARAFFAALGWMRPA